MNRRNRLLLMMLAIVLSMTSPGLLGASPNVEPSLEEPQFQRNDLYVSGTEGYHTFRIPALLTTRSGTLLAFAEGRKNSASDTGDIDIVLKRSFDGGATWEPLQIVCDLGVDTCGNPTPVQDESNGRIWLFMNHNYGEDTIEQINNGTSRGVRTVWSAYSDDDGATWSEPVNRFEEVQHPNTRWDATGPGNGIQLKHGPHAGRLVIPAIGRNIQSDDHGLTWYESTRINADTNEATVVELSDGTIMRNDRLSSNREIRRRAISTSADQGATWSQVYYDPVLIDPICQGSIIRYKPADNSEGDQTILFSNAAHENIRENMTVRISDDDGSTWSLSKTVYSGPSAYSSLAVLDDGSIGLLHEGGVYGPYEKIMFTTFNMEWMAAEEADLQDLQVSAGTLAPLFRRDLESYQLFLYSGTEQVEVTPLAEDSRISIEVNGQPAVSGQPIPIDLDEHEQIVVQTTLGDRSRSYVIELDTSREQPELLLHWDFDHMDENGVVDQTGNGHSGILKNGAEVIPGRNGDSLYLDGQRAHVEVSHDEDLHFGTDSFTFSAWVNPDVLNRQRHLLIWYGEAGRTLSQWWMSVEQNGAVRMNINGQPLLREVGVATPSGLVSPGEWTHIAGVRDDDHLKIYVNGELVITSGRFNSSLVDVTNNNAPVLIGFDKGGVANRDWNGSMDDVKLYRHALDPKDIRKLYEEQDTTAPSTSVSFNPELPNGENGWYASDVRVNLSASDDNSGVAATEYQINGTGWVNHSGEILVGDEGVNLLEYRSRDHAGNIETTQSVTISIDKSAPSLTITPDRSEIWPPNHQWIPIEIDVQASDSISGLDSFSLVSIESSEHENQSGEPGTEEFVKGAEFGTSDTSFSLKASRLGSGNGRIYTIKYEAVDLAGNTVTETATITVPHNQGNHN